MFKKNSPFYKFFSVGALATLIQYALLVILVEWLALAAAVASSIGYGTSSLFNYWANYHFTFQANSSHKGTIFRFGIITCAGLALNYLLMLVLADIFSIYYLLAQILATFVVFVFNYIAHKKWTYRR